MRAGARCRPAARGGPRLPAEEAIGLIEDVSALFEGGGDLLDRIGALL